MIYSCSNNFCVVYSANWLCCRHMLLSASDRKNEFRYRHTLQNVLNAVTNTRFLLIQRISTVVLNCRYESLEDTFTKHLAEILCIRLR